MEAEHPVLGDLGTVPSTRAEERAAKEQRFREFGPGYLYSSPLFSKTTLHDVTLRPTSNALRTIPST